MAPFIILIVTFFILRITGVLGITYFDGWYLGPGAVALMFLFTATANWGRDVLILETVPPSVPDLQSW